MSSTPIVLAASQCRRMINTVCCVYSKLPADDELLIYSNHVVDRLLEKIKKRNCIFLVFIKQIYHDARSREYDMKYIFLTL